MDGDCEYISKCSNNWSPCCVGEKYNCPTWIYYKSMEESIIPVGKEKWFVMSEDTLEETFEAIRIE